MAEQGTTDSAVTARMGTSCIYIANADDGDIGTYRLLSDGALRAGERVKLGALVGPLAISPNRRFLYAATRAQPFTVHAFAIHRTTGVLAPIGVSPLPESFPYISVDATGRFLLGASYGASMISVSAIEDDGRVAGQPLQSIAVPRNAHAIRADGSNRFVYVPALGTDLLYQFRFDAQTGRLSANSPPSVAVEPGSGPRHLAISPDNRFLYLLNEMRATVTMFALNASTGVAAVVATFSSLPPDCGLDPGMPRGPAAPPDAPARDAARDIWAAEIHLTPDGRFLYTSERTGSTLSFMRVDRDSGALAYGGSTSTEQQPRGFAIDPSGKFLVACGEKSETISVYAIDQATGGLRMLQKYPGGKGANWVSIIAL